MTASDAALRRAVLASTIDCLYSPAIRSALLSRRNFTNKYGIEIDVQLSIEDTDVSVSRTQLYSSIRKIFESPSKLVTVTDAQDRKWKVEIVDASMGTAALSRNKKRLILPKFWMLIPETRKRSAAFDEAAKKHNLPDDVRAAWQQRLEDSVLCDDEVDELLSEFRNTPVHVASQISKEVEEGSSGFESLVPQQTSYFLRLVGEYQEDLDLEDYIDQIAGAHLENLLTWDSIEGLKFGLLLSSHAKVSAKIDINLLSKTELFEVYEFLAAHGDRFSQVGAIELALPVIDQHPQLIQPLVSMIEGIRDDQPDSENSRFRLLSALIILVDGEASRSGLFRKEAPFWRRLATIAQASLIERCICAHPIDVATFSERANAGRGQQFYLQTLCDLRREPKWMPDFIMPDQLKAEFIGRLLNVGRENVDKIESTELKALLLDDGEASLQKLVQFPFPFFPGPLEGRTESNNGIPAEIAESINEALSSETVDAKTFVALINSVLVFKIDEKFVDQAVAALRRAKHYVKQGSDSDSFFLLISGLATLAAVSRNSELADDLRILVRRSNQIGAIHISAENVFRIGMIAAASQEKFPDWCNVVGDWITEIAFGDLTKDEAERLHSHVRCLCQIMPELWATLGSAEAALDSRRASIATT